MMYQIFLFTECWISFVNPSNLLPLNALGLVKLLTSFIPIFYQIFVRVIIVHSMFIGCINAHYTFFFPNTHSVISRPKRPVWSFWHNTKKYGGGLKKHTSPFPSSLRHYNGFPVEWLLWILGQFFSTWLDDSSHKISVLLFTSCLWQKHYNWFSCYNL